MQLGIADDIDEAVGRLHDKARKAQAQDSARPLPLNMDSGQPELLQGLFPRQKAQHPRRGHTLADHRRQCRAPDPHVERKNKNRIQGDIDDRPQNRRHHADPGKPLGVDIAVQAGSQHGKNRPDQIDAKILIRVEE